MAISKTPSSGLLMALVLGGCAARQPAVTNVGQQALTLFGADGKRVNLADVARQQPATVLVFWSATCPCVRRYQARVDELGRSYSPGHVRVLAVSSNADETFAEALAAASDRGVRTPLFRDEGGAVAAAVGARSTPTAVVLDARGAVRFIGWIDNEHEPGDPAREPWLERAVAGVLDDLAFAPRTRTFGCPITRSAGEDRPPCCSAPPRTSP